MAPLLKPSECIFLIIQRDGVINVQSKGDDSARVLEAAEICGIPTFYAAQAPGSSTTPAAGAPLSEKLIHDVETSASAWGETPLGAALAATGRPCLLLCGEWLDECVTFMALKALGEGYDVYLLTDASPALDVEGRETALLRLFQAGVVPTTTRQAVREWAADLADPARRTRLLALL